MTRRLSNFQRIVVFHIDKIHRNYDRVIAFTGPEGRGKSRGPFLHFVHEWYALQDKSVPKGRYGVDVKGFKNAVLTGARLDFSGLDEAGDVMNKEDSKNKFNRGMYKAYTVIREDGQCTGLTQPSLADFPLGFRSRRIHGVFHVHRRVDNKCKSCSKEFVGSACRGCGSTDFRQGFVVWRYYNRKNMNLLLYLNRNRKVFKMSLPGVRYIEGILREYRGTLIEEYTALKADKTKLAKEAFATIVDDLSRDEEEKKCPHCASRDFRWVASKSEYKCRSCPMSWAPSPKEWKQIKAKQKAIRGGEAQHD